MNNSILYCKFHTELCCKRPYWAQCSVGMLRCRLDLTEMKGERMGYKNDYLEFKPFLDIESIHLSVD